MTSWTRPTKVDSWHGAIAEVMRRVLFPGMTSQNVCCGKALLSCDTQSKRIKGFRLDKCKKTLKTV